MRVSPKARSATVGAIAAACLLGSAGPASAGPIHYTVKGLEFDVTTGPKNDKKCTILADLYKPDSATRTTPAPAILATNGFGGSKASEASMAKAEASRGYVVLSYSGLGFGGSDCKITLDDRDYDGKAGSQLVTFLGGGRAANDGTKVDYVRHDSLGHDGRHHANDPRLGMIGGSYGGQIQYAIAGIDPRVDTIIPIITWNDLSYSLAPNNTSFAHGVTYDTPGVEKAEWTSLFFGLGIVDGIEGAQGDPARNVGCPNFDDRACGSKFQMDATGAPNDATLAFARHASVESFVDQIRIPTLLEQGEADTLFNLQEEIATYRSLKAQGVPVKMTWRYGGHSQGTKPGEVEWDNPASGYNTRTYSQWFDHYLAGIGPSPPLDVSYFRDWVQYKGDATPAYARADAYPFAKERTMYLSGGNALVDSSAQVTAGNASFSTPSAGAPASYTETSALDQDQPVRDVPGTFAQFQSAPLAGDTDVIGVPTADVSITAPTFANAVAAGGAPAALVLFFKLYDLKPDGTIVLANRLIAPVRIVDFDHPVHVELPGIVHRFAKGDRVALTVAASDAAYRGNNASGPVTIDTSPGSPGVLKLPIVAASDQAPITASKTLLPAINIAQLAGGLLDVPRGACAARRKFKLKIHKRNGVKIKSAAIFVNGKRVKTVKGRSLRHTFTVRRLPKGPFKLRVVIRGLKHGKHVKIKDSRRYGSCKHHRRGGKHHHATGTH